jgi:hypothetical protein
MTDASTTEPDGTTVVALLRAMLADDREGAAALMSTVNPHVVIGVMAGWVNGEGIKTHGSAEAWDAVLAEWQAAALQ